MANLSYFKQRLKTLNITAERNKITAYNNGVCQPDFHFFSEDKDGNITINYLSPEGNVQYYDAGKGKLKQFSRTRYKEPDDPKKKYSQPAGSGIVPFITPLILSAYKTKEQIKTLYVTEGEFKAFAIDNFNLPCIGIGGIHNFKSKEKDSIHQYITDIICKCQVENIVLLFDADCLNVEWKEDKELTTRLASFYTAVDTFNELLKPYDVCVYFAHIKKDSIFKGIDDLLYNGFDAKNVDVIKELSALLVDATKRNYINTYKITGTSSYNIKQIFNLNSVFTFFSSYVDILRDKEFIFQGNSYYLDENEKLSVSWKGQQNNYMRIGCDYYKKVVGKSPNGQHTEIDLVSWKIATIKSDYYNSKEFLNRVQKCDGFTNIPENNPKKYKQIVESEKDGIKSTLYNRYMPVSHVPVPGEWQNINTLLHHIFDYQNLSGASLYEFALDYLQLLYTQPIKKLPVICLVSKENGTGKTTFLNLLRSIFIENMRILDSDRFSSQFTSAWAGKLIVAIDESLIAWEKESVKNRIKMIATNPTIPLEQKGVDSKEIPNFSKLIMCSNDESNFMRIDEEENRYCVVKVKAIEKAKNDPFLFEKMESEIPAFLHFLKNRAIYYPEKSRLYFSQEVYETPALKKVMERTENPLHKHIKNTIREQFLNLEQTTIDLSLQVIFELVRPYYTYCDPVKIKEYLNDGGFKTGNSTNFKYVQPANPESFIFRKDRCYRFEAQNWFTEDEMKTHFSKIKAIEEKDF